jgi:hypothetical protein
MAGIDQPTSMHHGVPNSSTPSIAICHCIANSFEADETLRSRH